MFRVCIYVNEGRRASQLDYTESKLDQGADGNDGVRGPWHQPPLHPSPWGSELEGQNHSNGFGQDCENCYSKNNSKCYLLKNADGCVGTADEEQGAEETEGKRGEQDIAESPIIGLDYEDVLVLHKDPKGHTCDNREQTAVQARVVPQ